MTVEMSQKMSTKEFMEHIQGWRLNPLLTKREREVCELYEEWQGTNLLTSAILSRMNIAKRTLAQYRFQILEKMGVPTKMRTWPSYSIYIRNIMERRQELHEKESPHSHILL